MLVLRLIELCSLKKEKFEMYIEMNNTSKYHKIRVERFLLVFRFVLLNVNNVMSTCCM